MPQTSWPALPLDGWQDTKDTLHRYLQLAGKVRTALTPEEPQFGNSALYVTARGLTTGPMPCGDKTLQIDFDFIAHKLTLATSDGGIRSLSLEPRSVADFYRMFLNLLKELKVDCPISPVPQEVPDVTPLDQDTKHASYDAGSVQRFFHVLSRIHVVLTRFRAPFRGRHTAINLFWGAFDLCYDRFSGKRAAPPPGAPYLFRKTLDAEQIYVGFWPGDARYPQPAFASYTYPKPQGIEQATLKPASARWNSELGEFVLNYDDVRSANSPEQMLMEFLTSAFETGAALAGWDESLRR